MTKKQLRALKRLRDTIDAIAASSEYPPPPGNYFAIKTIWKSMVMIARRAKVVGDAAFGKEE